MAPTLDVLVLLKVSEVQANQDILMAGPSNTKSPRIENSNLENFRASLKDEIPSEIKGLLVESQKGMLKLLRPKTNGNTREEPEDELENKTSFNTPTKSVRINSIQNNGSYTSRNNFN